MKDFEKLIQFVEKTQGEILKKITNELSEESRNEKLNTSKYPPYDFWRSMNKFLIIEK